MKTQSDMPETRPDLFAAMERFGFVSDPEEVSKLRQIASILNQPEPRPVKNAKTSSELKMLQQVNEGLSAHTEMLACALGACPKCWGGDPDCTRCAGEGRPGFFLPDELCFQRYVLPVIDRILRENKSPARKQMGQDNPTTHSAPE